MKEQKKNKGSVLVAESAHNAKNAQFGLVMMIAYKKNVFSSGYKISLIIQMAYCLLFLV